MNNDAAIKYLESLLGHNLRAHTTDGVSAPDTNDSCIVY